MEFKIKKYIKAPANQGFHECGAQPGKHLLAHFQTTLSRFQLIYQLHGRSLLWIIQCHYDPSVCHFAFSPISGWRRMVLQLRQLGHCQCMVLATKPHLIH